LLAAGLVPRAALAQRGGPPQAAKVEVSPVVERSLSAGYTFSGTVMPARRATLGSAVEGRLQKIVDDGLWVRAEQPVARLLTDTINIEIKGAKAELDMRANEQKEMDAGSRKEEIAMAKAKFEGMEALTAYAKSRHDRAKSLFEQGQATSREEVELALSAYIAAQKNQAAAAAEHELAIQGPRLEKRLQAADRFRMQQQVVKELEDRRSKFYIRSYFNGYVTAKHAEIGAWIKQGDPIVEVIELDPAEISVSIPEAQIAKVVVGMKVQVRIDAVSMRDFWTGEVARIIPQADLRSRTFTVKVRLDNPEDPLPAPVPMLTSKSDGPQQSAVAPTVKASTQADAGDDSEKAVEIVGENKQHKFKAGMIAKVSLRLGAKEKALLVHKDALVLGGATLDGQPSYTLLVARAGAGGSYTAVPLPVAIGLFDGDWVEVTSRTPQALKPGDLVVSVGNERLQPGQAIAFEKK
jgi:multidrug efflux pump subunit AcrA (membrane-fusion protein)